MWRPNAPKDKGTSAGGAASPASGQTGPAQLFAQMPGPVRLLLVVLALLLFWYGVIGTFRAGILVDFSTRPSAEQLPPGGSVVAGMAQTLITQQVDERAFTPNDPVFYPTGLTHRTPAFQEALIETLGVGVKALTDADPADPALAAAARALAISPRLWWIDGGWPPLGLPAERHYLAAAEALRRHNVQLAESRPERSSARPRLSAAGNTVLAALLERIELEAERGDRLIRDPSAGSAADQIARARGTAYAATLLLRGLREDNAAAIRISGRAARWTEAQDALDAAARLDPFLVREDDLVKAGYSLLLAGNAMRAILEGSV